MPSLTAAALRKQLNAGEPGPLYLLLGDDDVEKAAVAGEFVDLVDEGLRAFNVDRLYGGETSVDALIDAANTFPMMAPRRVVLVLEAERLLIPKRESQGRRGGAGAARSVPPEPLAARDRRVRLRFARHAAAHLEAAGARSAGGGLRHDRRRGRRRAVGEGAGGARQGAARPGRGARARGARRHDLVRLRAGLERVALYAMGQPTITADDVRQSVPAGPDQQQDFGIANAIRQGDAGEALKQLGRGARRRGARRSSCWDSSASRPNACRGRGCVTRWTRSSAPTSRSSRAEAIRGCCWSGWSWSCAASRGAGWAAAQRALGRTRRPATPG